MKYTIPFFLMIYFLFGFTLKSSDPKEIRPPGTQKIVNGFYFDATERTNMDWREYLSWIEHKGAGKNSIAYKAALPNEEVWIKEGQFNPPFVETYLNHAAFNDYPVVGISREQAQDYCKWRTERVIEMYKANNIPVVELEYRLPTILEWELIATTGRNDDAKKTKKLLKKHGWQQKKFYTQPENLADQKVVNSTAPVRTFLPDGHGIYHIIGNVAEMVAEEGIAKGGSWEHPYEEGIISKNFVYDAPQRWLGFRCVCEVSSN